MEQQYENATGDTPQQPARVGAVHETGSGQESRPHPSDVNGRRWLERHPPANDDNPHPYVLQHEPR